MLLYGHHATKKPRLLFILFKKLPFFPNTLLKYVVFPIKFAIELSEHLDINYLYSLKIIQQKLYHKVYAVVTIYIKKTTYAIRAIYVIKTIK